jgi:ADP-heptose:LPS heptosyltransferase
MTLLLLLIKVMIRAKMLPLALKDVKRILVVDFAFLGDMVMTYPLYRALKELFPGARVEVLAFPMSKELLQLNPYVDAVHVHPQGMARVDLATIARLRKKGYDLGIQVNTSVRNNFILWLIHPRYRLGYDYRHRGCFHNLRVPIATRTARMTYRVDEELALLERAVGRTIANREMIFPVSDKATAAVRERLRTLGIGDQELLIGLHTNSRQTRELRQWDAAKFALLTDALVERHNAKVIFTGTASDGEYVDGIIARVHAQKQACKGLDFTLEELGGLFGRLSLFVTINTGPMHIAIAQRTPTVAIIGGTPARVIFPSNNPIFQYIMDPALETWDPRPLHHRYVPRMQEIEVAEVLRKADLALKAAQARRTAP